MRRVERRRLHQVIRPVERGRDASLHLSREVLEGMKETDCCVLRGQGKAQRPPSQEFGNSADFPRSPHLAGNRSASPLSGPRYPADA
ncbi:hypothetical protein E2C01_090221 [Portunus trituberculatus]|uniref:Uncharacterized protein n=1 Tax=Portunus trituberculatus TaxID=210409 RepID=A0A5B7JPK4_PORTR|nr:hypothetical protein [Portunus trituberculatus]